MNKIKVAIIDSGVDINHHWLLNTSIKSVEVAEKDEKLYIRNSIYDYNGHGTAIAGIIKDKGCCNLELLSIKVLNEELKCKFNFLCKAIEFAIEQKVHIINLSLGITNKENEDKLRELCQRAIDNGIYIVSAFHNRGIKSYPAVFEEVFGVIGGDVVYKYGYHCISPHNNEYMANGASQRVCWMYNSYKYVNGNSFACAHFTGILSLHLSQNPSLNKTQLKELLIENSRSIETLSQKSIPIDSIAQKAVCFPLEPQNLMLTAQQEKKYEIIGIYDNRDFCYDYYEHEQDNKTHKLKIYNNLDEALLHADTLLIGDISYIEEKKRNKLIRALLEKAIAQGKNVISKDTIHPEDFEDLFLMAEDKKIIIRS